MRRFIGKKWTGEAAFLCIALAMVLGVRYIAVGSVPEASPMDNAQNFQHSWGMPASDAGASIMLYLDRPVALDQGLVTYRGEDDRRVRIDLKIPRLDADYTYHKQILLARGQGNIIRLAGIDYRLTTVRRGYIRLDSDAR